MVKHVLGISGGKDSAALAIYMKDNYPDLEMEYFFTDTGKELDETYEFLISLEGYLGKPITRLGSHRDFDFWLAAYNGYLPSPQARWCTNILKLKPFKDWAQQFIDQGHTVYSYVAIREDEPDRSGFISSDDKMIVKFPFREDGIDKQDVFEILENSGVGVPKYYDWRSRSGCTFCFFQRKIEWVGLLERHPEAYKEAMKYEGKFTWCQGESLEELAKPERVAQIKANHEKEVAKAKKVIRINPLRPEGENEMTLEDIYGEGKMCVMCHK